ncbi:nitrate/nitrite transporter [Mammaliicoccus lentus]|jgi:NNP family putative nitrate transporter|uniref:Probable nitrate transporter NarT n=1 Tax=Mammaliicoccus lentus TaxID=42858 RepID=A0AAX3W3T6_MAMLE|nr:MULTISPECIES: nitrate/nitrite transporter [Mammaliicoccus]HBV04781.1 NarK/NasA family nitrate transporter [Staphylococcus sp.]MBF0748247.1 NarK/NasA family nitrate transporter [Mammaliicoccus lentus]MBW0766513.1 NarK/NasA family nitrate transporter [Mammaliicoccus lentus]MBW0769613.1 NarK/NasA family nitrate transporter [Mammaliicoccus lentus]MCR1872427.1 NarK/NasA family nitrate transporter [Mammaliicoccus lentus]
MKNNTGKVQLPLQTLSLMAGFMVWSILAPLMPYISQDFNVPESQKAIILAIPVILGSILRIPIGYYTNLIGSRLVFLISFIILIFPVFYLSQATSTTGLMIAGFFIGLGGAVFSVGVTSIPKYYPKEKHGFANGIYGMGNLGTAVSSFLAPPIAGAIGWQHTVQLYVLVMALFAILMFVFGDKQEPKVKVPMLKQTKQVANNYKLYYFSFWYFITFGAFVAFGLFLPNFLVGHFEIDKVDAGIRTGVFIAIATILRPIGGMLGDKFNALNMLKIFFGIMIAGALILALSNHIMLFTIGCLTISVSAGIGNGLIFKLVPTYFSKEAGVVNGIVSMMGGLGGFFPPLIITMVTALTGSNHLAFFLLAIFGLVALISMMHMTKVEKKTI